MAMNESVLVDKKIEITGNYEMSTFHQKSHFWGRLTIWTVLALSMLFPLYLSFVLGFHPGWGPIIAGYLTYATMIGKAWIVEPISYYPTLGISGTYQAFLTGNISNMCLPVAAAAQNYLGVQPGTKKGEITATLAIAAASLTNMTILFIIIFSGSYLLSIIPESVQKVFPFIIPAIFGGILAQFAIKKPTFGVIALAVGLAINLLAIPLFLKGLLCIILTVVICYYMEKIKLSKTGV
jgi:hypothetical protein